MKSFKCFVSCLVLTLLALPGAAQSNGNPVSCQQIVAGHRYAFVFQGFVDLGPPLGLTPNAGGGTIRFQTDGTFSAWSSLSVGGVIVTYPLHGTYQMEPGTEPKAGPCRGTATGEDGTTLQLVVSRDGSELEQMHTDSGLVVVVGAELAKGACSNASLRGDYIYSANGFFAPPGFPLPFGNYIPFAFSGVTSFDGKGNVVGWDTVSLAGNIVPRTYSGTYQVGRNCVVTTAAADSLGNQFHTLHFIYAGAKKVAVVNTDAGTVLAFNAKRD